MTRLDPAGEPSMEEILASIRRIIAEDPPGSRPVANGPQAAKSAAPLMHEPSAQSAPAPARADAAALAAREADSAAPRPSPNGLHEAEAIPQGAATPDINAQLADVLGSAPAAPLAPAMSTSASVQAALDSLLPANAGQPRKAPELSIPQPRAGFTFARDGFVPPAETPVAKDAAKNEPAADPFEFSLGPSPFARAPASERAARTDAARPSDPFGSLVPSRDVLQMSPQHEAAPPQAAIHSSPLTATPSTTRREPDFSAMSSRPGLASELPAPQAAPSPSAPHPFRAAFDPSPTPKPFAAAPAGQPEVPAAPSFGFSPAPAPVQPPAPAFSHPAEAQSTRPVSTANLSELAPLPSVWPSRPLDRMTSAPNPLAEPVASAGSSVMTQPEPSFEPAPPSANAQPGTPAMSEADAPMSPAVASAEPAAMLAEPAPFTAPASPEPASQQEMPAPAQTLNDLISVALEDGPAATISTPNVELPPAAPEEPLEALQHAPDEAEEAAEQTQEAVFEEALRDGGENDDASGAAVLERHETNVRALISAEPMQSAASSNEIGVPRTMEDTVAELLRPMLRNWLAENMPRIVERALRKELDDSSRSEHKPAAE